MAAARLTQRNNINRLLKREPGMVFQSGHLPAIIQNPQLAGLCVPRGSIRADVDK